MHGRARQRRAAEPSAVMYTKSYTGRKHIKVRGPESTCIQGNGDNECGGKHRIPIPQKKVTLGTDACIHSRIGIVGCFCESLNWV